MSKTDRDPIYFAHDHNPNHTRIYPQRRRTTSASTTGTRSTRSPSPKVSFTPSEQNVKGVKNITRKVIRTLEGLGHLDLELLDMDLYEREGEGDDRDGEGSVVRIVNGAPNGNGVIGNENRMLQAVNGLANGSAKHGVVHGRFVKGKQGRGKKENKEIDWEIPRKVLHSSIGFFTAYLYVSQSSSRTVVLVLWTALAVIVPAELLRLRYPRFERVYERFWGFLMRDSEKNTVNGVVWYILGVNFALSCYPPDVATVAILILSWADTAASTIGRLLGAHTPPLPRHTPFLRLPLAPRKSLAGFVAASVTGACIAIGFWGWVAPLRDDAADVSWSWEAGVQGSGLLVSWLGVGAEGGWGGGGWLGLGLIGVVAGLVSGVAEALDLGSLDDNLTLPIISGGCLFGLFKLLGLFSSAPT